MNIQEIRQQYPQYNDMSDQQLADSMYSSHYSDMPRDDFNQKIGMPPTSFAQNPTFSKFGTAAIQTAKDLPGEMFDSFTHLGRMVYGDQPFTTGGQRDPILTNNLGETANNISSLAMPFLGVPEDNPNLINMMKAKAEKPIPVTPQQLDTLSSHVFTKADQAGGALDPEDTNNFIDFMRSTARDTPEGQVFRGSQNPILEKADNLEVLRDKPLSFAGASDLDNQLSDLISANSENGKLNSQGQQWYQIQDKLRELMTPDEGDETGFSLRRQGQQLWGQSRSLADIQKIISNAQTAQNPSQALITGFRTLSRNQKRMNFFTDEEQDAINDAAQRGLTGDFFNTFGSRLGPLIGAGVGSVGGPIGSLIGGGTTFALSKASRDLATKLQMNKANSVMDLIRNRNELPDLNINPQESPKLLSAPNNTFVGTKEGQISQIPVGSNYQFGQYEGMPFQNGELNEARAQDYHNMPIMSDRGQSSFLQQTQPMQQILNLLAKLRSNGSTQ